MESMSSTVGALRERVTILQRSASSDGQGGREVAYVVLEAVAAAIAGEPASSEPVQAGAVTARARYRVRLRFRSDVTSTMRLRWRTKTLQILSVVPDVRRAWLLLQCAEVQ